MTNDLSSQKCVPCEGGTEPLKEAKENLYHEQTPDWDIIRDDIHQLEKDFSFDNFKDALHFVNIVGEIAEVEGHHPDIYLHDYKHVLINLYTHAIGGLSVNDFIVASKIEKRLQDMQKS